MLLKNLAILAISIPAAHASGISNTASVPAFTTPSEPNVILVMVDGVRWNDFFHGQDPSLSGGKSGPLMETFHREVAPQGVLFGDRLAGNTMLVGNPIKKSLPGYQSIMAGATQPCGSNECGRIKVETVQERLLRELKLDSRKVATLASWKGIAHAVEHVEGRGFVNTGVEPMRDTYGDTESAELNLRQESDLPPFGDARWDKYTWAHAMRYVRVHRPRFLFVSMNDADEFGHAGKYDEYTSALRRYDQWMKELVALLDTLGDYGKSTTILMTTDHGRGNGPKDWRHHRSSIEGSQHVFLYARNLATLSRKPGPKISEITHLNIRPTIEALLGLAPCVGCAAPIREILGD